MTEYKRFEGETDEALILRVCRDKPIIGSWDDVCAILNKLLGANYKSNTYRNKFQSYDRLRQVEIGKSDSDLLNEIKEQRRELEKERKKIQTEKIEYNKWLREDARDELITEKIIEAIKEANSIDIPTPYEFQNCYLNRRKVSNKTGILCFGDEHYGVSYEIKGLNGEILNAYSPEIFEKRMWDLFTQVIDIVIKEELDTISIYSLGDFSDGILRIKQLFKLRYGVIEGSVKYAKFLVEWLNQLSKYVKIRFQMVKGNHTELRLLGQPKGTFSNENMDYVVREMIRVCLNDNPNFEYIENPTGLIFETIYGQNFLGIHGEVKNMETALREFSNMYNVQIDYLIGGHLHHGASEEIGINREVIRVPSIIGIDDYSMELRKTANAGATMLVLEEGYGIKVKYPIKLN